MEELTRRYEHLAVEPVTLLLLRFPDAEQFVVDCQNEGLVVLRMDFYRLEGHSIRPTLLYADLFEFKNVENGSALAAAAALAILRREMPNGETLVSFEALVAERRKS